MPRRTLRLTRLGKATLVSAVLALGVSLALPLLMRSKRVVCPRWSAVPIVHAVDLDAPGVGRVRLEDGSGTGLRLQDERSQGGGLILTWGGGWTLRLGPGLRVARLEDPEGQGRDLTLVADRCHVLRAWGVEATPWSVAPTLAEGGALPVTPGGAAGRSGGAPRR